jgi:ribosomal protein L11 methyltransferase
VRRQLTLEVTAASVPGAEALLDLAGAESIALADAGDEPVLEPPPETMPLWPTVKLRAVFPAGTALDAVAELLRSACHATHVEIGILEDADWQNAIRQVFKARPFGARLWLAPADDGAVPPGRIGLRLHMGLAFGTGEHPTTALCLDGRDAHVTEGMTVLDYGCGSGVLAIAALALGASHAWATDNDPQALEATRANSELNGAAGRLEIFAPEALPAVAADVVAANILAGALIALAPRLAAHVKPRGAIVLSGILESQAAQVEAAFEPYFTAFSKAEQLGWVALTAIKRGAG